MLVKVGAARREWSNAAVIYDEPISEDHATTAPDGSLQITFVASGIYGRDRESSKYRYTVKLSPAELTILIGAGSL
ncbi:hypothetical protein [Brucella intermedia]|uniref:hypothetical protein n=1 Tax=Brucella intermedia TaxID=94625 RepID=UPI00124D66A3|nr:hypothetical protein [Brucella intermedia]KAB2720385.1 hypothetical protein F9K75_04755 [Brucella intermedia]WGJ06620.1 hypothetical protein QBQ48_12280 [Brucella intermedia]